MKTSVDNIDFSVYNLSNLTKKKPEIKKNKVRDFLLEQNVEDNIRLLQLCSDYWSALQDFRDRRERSRKYLRGDQWHETIEDPDNPGTYITEEEYIKNQGKIPFKQNIIRQLVKNVVGQYRINPTQSMVITRNRENQEEGEMMSQVLRAAKDLNRCSKLDTRNWEEFILSGLPLQKIGFKFWDDRDQEDLYIENINNNRIFFNSDVADVRLHDLNLIGEIRDVDVDDIISAFAQNESEAQLIKDWYNDKNPDNITSLQEALSADRIENLDFLISEQDKARLIEVWQLKSEWRLYFHDYMTAEVGFTDKSKEELQLINAARIAKAIEQNIPEEEVPLIEFWDKLDRFWYVKFLTPFGHCLYEGETPYLHKSHPYVMLAYPMLDGEVWGMVEDIIDQQRYINRLISLMDFIMGSSAKGVLLVPEDAIPDDMNIDDFVDEWTKFNGVIKFKAKQGIQIPQQISSKAVNIGAMDMLSLQMKLVQDIAGVSSAIQGQQAKSGTPSSLYAQEAQNSGINLKDYIDEYGEFKRDRDLKALKVILQYYNDKRTITVPGTRQAFVHYDPDKIKELEFDIVVSQSTDTPVYRQLVDDTLFQLLQAQFIDIKMYLENSSLPFADKLLNDINQRQAENQNQVSPELLQQMSEAGKQIPQNEKSQQLLQRLLGNGEKAA